jgi:hypothetical protein
MRAADLQQPLPYVGGQLADLMFADAVRIEQYSI